MIDTSIHNNTIVGLYNKSLVAHMPVNLNAFSESEVAVENEIGVLKSKENENKEASKKKEEVSKEHMENSSAQDKILHFEEEEKK